MANIITSTIQRFQTAVRERKIRRIVDSTDDIFRESLNRRVIDKRGVTPETTPMKGGSIIGKLKKRLAPTRDLQMDGIYLNRFNMTDLYAIYVGEPLMKFTIDRHVEATIRNGYYIKSKNPVVTQYLNKRIKEFEVVSGSSYNEYLRDFAMCLILYGNAFIIKYRQEDASSGKSYKRWDEEALEPIASLYVEDPRKMLLGEGPGGKMRYVRMSRDVAQMNINLLNPSLFTLPRPDLYANNVSIYANSYNIFSSAFGASIANLFSLTPKRRKEYIVYENEDIDHVRYHHIPGEKIAMPPFWPVLNDIDALRRIEENIELLVFQYGHPILHGRIGDEKLAGQVDEINQLQTRLESMESNGFVITDNRTLLTMVGSQNAALRLESYLEHFFRRVLAGLWLSEIAIGIGDTSNRATANTLDKISQEKVLEIQRIISETMQSIFIELLQEAGARLDWILSPENVPTFEFHNVDIEGMIKKEQHTQVMWSSNMLTEDEMRLELGREPMTDEERQNTYLERVSIPLAEAQAAAKAKAAAVSGSGKQASTPRNQHGRKTGPGGSQNG